MHIPIRIGRVAAAALLFPGHEVPAIAASECISTFVPILNKTFMEKVLHAIIVVMYAPKFSHAYVFRLSESNDTKYQQAEICSMLLFFLTCIIYNYN